MEKERWKKQVKLGGVKGAAVRGPPAPHVHGQQLLRPRGALRAVNRITSFREKHAHLQNQITLFFIRKMDTFVRFSLESFLKFLLQRKSK